MADFTTLAKMKIRYDDRTLVKLSDDTGTGLIASACVNAIITKATGYIQRYICKRYSTSTATSGDILETMCEEAVIAMLYQRRGTVPRDIWEQHRDNIKFLEDVQNGIADLPGHSATEDVFLPSRANSYQDSGAGRQFDFLNEDSSDFVENP